MMMRVMSDIRTILTGSNVDHANLLYVVLLGFLPLAFGSLASFWYFYGIIFYLYLYASGKIDFTINKENGLASLACLSYFSSHILSLIINFNQISDFIFPVNYLGFLFFPIAAFGLSAKVSKTPYLITFLKASCFAPYIAMIAAILQTDFILIGGRAKAFLGNPIIFGSISLLFFGFCLLAMHKGHRWLNWVALGGALCSLYCVMISGSRGVLLALPVLLAAFAWKIMKDRVKITYVLVGFAFLCIAAFSIFKTTSLASRLEISIAELRSAQSSTQIMQGEDGVRIYMWTYGLKAGTQNPLFGWGDQNRQKAVTDLAASEGVQIRTFTHLHNQIITEWVSGGILGVAALLFLLIVPLVIALRSGRDAFFNTRVVFAVLLSGCYTAFGQTNIIFGHDLMNTVYLSCLLILSADASQSHERVKAERQDEQLT